MPKLTKDETTGERTYEFSAVHTTRIILSKNCLIECSNCGKLRPLQLRTMPDGTIRNQPQCSTCRNRYKKRKT